MGFEPIGFVLERVYDILKHEASILLVDEKSEIEGMKWELEDIESYLKDMDEVERLATVNHVLRTKVQHLRQILPQIEDLLDIVSIRQIQPSFFEKMKAFCSCASNPLIQKHHLVGEITGIREKLNDIRRPEGYPLPNNNSQVIYKRRLQTDPNIIDHEIIIGLEEDVRNLVAKFVGNEGERGANLAIVGMGGSGKTTLARQFYNHQEIKKAFPRRAWVCVSQEWNTRNLLLDICEMLGVKLLEGERFPHVKLEEILHQQGSCLIVLDDVWERKALQDFLPTLLTGNGRVLITTRKEGIVRFPGIASFHVHNMRRLTAEQSRELFSEIVSNNKVVIVKFKEEEKEEEDFAKLGRVMLEKCGGLPIAIVTLAGLLGTKDTIQQWESIKDNVISIIMEDERGSLRYEAVKKVLEFSYFDLPYYLKPCFLYLGTFIEDVIISANILINLWIDEGFVNPDQCPERRRLKEVAKNFLEELVQRCMVQVVSRDYAGDVSEIRIHDLMRDLCIDKANELGFFRFFSPSTTSSTQIEPCSRAIIHIPRNSRAESIVLDKRLRTLICINEDRYGEDLPKQLFPFETLKQVRVLSLQWVELGDSVENIGNMVLLRYLNLCYCRFTTVKMDFLKKLRNLQTFIFQMGGSMKLSDNMFGSMEQLRVLYVYLDENRAQSPAISLGVDKLRNLQTLFIKADEWIAKELPAINSTDLQELVIHKIHSQPQLDNILCCVNSNTLTRLETLKLFLESELLEFDLQKMKLERRQHLKSLYLCGKIKKERGSRWSFPPNLLSLNLMGTRVEEEDDMNQVIAQLNQLRELFLRRNSYNRANLTMSGLPNLHKLSLVCQYSLKEWRITEGSLPQLRELLIWECRELERIPDGIRNLKTLQLLEVFYMPRRFCKRLEKREEDESEGGEDFHLVQHIPTLIFKYIKD